MDWTNSTAFGRAAVASSRSTLECDVGSSGKSAGSAICGNASERNRPGAPRECDAADRPRLHRPDWSLRHYDGLPEAVINDPEMMSALIKPMRADVEILETYRPEAPVRLACPTTLLGGEDDPVVRPDLLERWASHVHAFVPVLLPGGHFYFRKSLPVLIDLVVSILRPVLRAMPR
ncbi:MULTISPECIES: thioesterase II family protein [Bradyrhizobium]|uniref:thioesterase II family protein n=1 Tax=Bradyrhizobium TaxID=374 RepID=UPI002167526D|nr:MULTISPECIES: thioesterase domain-containing protein [Bradyrhizobium]MDI2058162.1 thioesterase domain-containing protein [Bradyrhizobium sp. Mp19]MDI2111558.1 thioesterase domain-containing protein [Bradyrhizobium sp. Mp64]WLA49548.1 thioesterase domain-containing protein [Bradyrhizobium elkanii]WLB10797.1 thioesterase domain-containing protein [Bradyrhizobium elkanii]